MLVLCLKLSIPSQELFIRRVKQIYQNINEQSLETDYEFMSEADMNAAGFSERLTEAKTSNC